MIKKFRAWILPVIFIAYVLIFHILMWWLWHVPLRLRMFDGILFYVFILPIMLLESPFEPILGKIIRMPSFEGGLLVDLIYVIIFYFIGLYIETLLKRKN